MTFEFRELEVADKGRSKDEHRWKKYKENPNMKLLSYLIDCKKRKTVQMQEMILSTLK